MVPVFDYVLFGVLVAANLALGLYYSLRKPNAGTPTEVFLGSRALKMLPLAASSVASLASSPGLVGFPAHFYAYGWHLMWSTLTPLLLIRLATHVFVPLLYGLGVTSIFEYIRMRFNALISLTACAIYIFLTQTVGAMSIFAASLTLVTGMMKGALVALGSGFAASWKFGIFSRSARLCGFTLSNCMKHKPFAFVVFFFIPLGTPWLTAIALKAPLFWCNVTIGLSATVYTTLGGLRGVVFTDCMQFLFILIAPTTIVVKILIDSFAPNSTIQPLGDLDVKKYAADYSFDLKNDENIWSYVFGTAAVAFYRMCMDQMVVQRIVASRTPKDARRIVVTGTLLLVLMYLVGLLVGVSLTIWFRGCDPGLSGAIKSIDQILPYYINNYLVNIPGFVGLFMAGVVSAATSTISSAINSQAAVLYVDVISRRYKKAEEHTLLVTRVTALILGIIMTIYSTLCIYMGSLTRIILMIYSAVTAPFVGLCILAVLFPFVHSKGAGVATLITITYQLWNMAETIRNRERPTRMPVSVDYCPTNLTTTPSISNTSFAAANMGSGGMSLFRVSPLWSSFFAVFATIIIGVLFSAMAGEISGKREQPKLSSDALVRLWRKPTSQPSDIKKERNLAEHVSTRNDNAEDDELLQNATESIV